MPYVLSKLANTQVYTKYIKGTDNFNQAVAFVTINGGADVTNKLLVTPQGVVTEISAEQLDLLKENKVFQQHLENGVVSYYSLAPDVDKKAPKMKKDKSAQLQKKDFEDKGIKPEK